MRTFLIIALTLLGGFIVGIVLSEAIVLIGFAIFDTLPIGFRVLKFLPFVAAIVSAAIGFQIAQRRTERGF